ncbi:MAG: preprotein translocase subunit YajC [Acidimicrobiaceae bacterium]|nr:preprotein translocase subunit YajC [Acidimicrobiaceae bacterium]
MLLAKTSGSSTSILIIYVVVFGALYFLYLRPRSKKQKAARLQSRKVEVGDRAQTIGGFVGTVIHQDADLVTLRSSGGIELEFVPSAIAKRFDPPTHDDADAEHESEEGDNK